jgi:hypothetical protein
MKRVVILQSNYIPWKGYFDLIASADECILFDDAQYTKGDWRNRNRIKTPSGIQWLTVPVLTKGSWPQKISDVLIAPGRWAHRHWNTLTSSYGRSQHFESVAGWLAPLYLERSYSHLSTLNHTLLGTITEFLRIPTKLRPSSALTMIEGKTTRLVSLCRQVGATEYISGPGARTYLDEEEFRRAGIRVTWHEYRDYPEYSQPWGPFTHEVSILDLLFNCGHDAARYMRSAQG